MLDSFIGYLTKVTRKEKKIVNIYFHNFSRFDGILLIRHLIDRHPEWKLELLMNNNVLYELVVHFTQRVKLQWNERAEGKWSFEIHVCYFPAV
jgi:hypothetical protein